MKAKVSKHLPTQPAREYTMREGLQGRVWRNAASASGREGMLFTIGAAVLCLLNDRLALMTIFGVMATCFLAVHLVGLYLVTKKRVRLIQTAPAVKGVIGLPRRAKLFHEVFKRQLDKTYVLPYTFQLPDGFEEDGEIWICGCAREHLPHRSVEWIVYDPENPRQNLPLRLAVMVVPH